MLTTPFYVVVAEQTLRDLKCVYEEEPVFAPILFIHTLPIEFPRSGLTGLRLAPLGDVEQQEWPRVIRRMIEDAGTDLWGLATEVSMRFRYKDSSQEPLLRSEDWLVYLMCHRGAMLAWGAPIQPGRRLGIIRELTDDPRLQKMLAHLSEVTPGEGN